MSKTLKDQTTVIKMEEIRAVIEKNMPKFQTLRGLSESAILSVDEAAYSLTYDVLTNVLDARIEVEQGHIRAELVFKDNIKCASESGWTSWYGMIARKMGAGADVRLRGLTYHNWIVQDNTPTCQAIDEFLNAVHSAHVHIHDYKAKARTVLMNNSIPNDIALELLEKAYGRNYTDVSHVAMNTLIETNPCSARRRLMF